MLRRRFWCFGALALSMVACEPPPRAVPVLPPGITQESRFKPTEDQEAKAVGEPSNLALAAPDDKPKVKEPDTPPEIGDVPSRTTPGGLKIQIVGEGEGDAVAGKGSRVTVHYTGWVEGGHKFDSSRDRGEPFLFTLGRGDVIKGWDEGVAGMKLHERRRLTIPPELAYGSQGNRSSDRRKTGIPPNSTLIFDVELRGTDSERGPQPAPAVPKPQSADMPDPFSPPGT